MRRFAVAFAVCMATSVALVAEEPVPDTHAAAARELLGVMNLEQAMMAGATAMIDVQIKQNAMLAPYRDVMVKWAQTFLTWEAFAPKLVQLYAESYSESELRELITFYKTPTGQKSLKLMPELTQRSAALGAEIAKEHSGELEAMVRERAQELEKLTAKP